MFVQYVLLVNSKGKCLCIHKCVSFAFISNGILQKAVQHNINKVNSRTVNFMVLYWVRSTLKSVHNNQLLFAFDDLMLADACKIFCLIKCF